jgi:TM2 domain-containing membrane protein YozV
LAAARLRTAPRPSGATAVGLPGIPTATRLSAAPARLSTTTATWLSNAAAIPRFGRDPATGLPLSDKSATTAGLLQLFFGVFGIGRFYIDSTQIAIAQFLLGLSALVFTLFCLFGLPFLLGSIVWAIVDAILMFTGSVKDNHGRKLR